jgi:hypothetical protein
MDRRVWLRIIVQIAIAAVLVFVVPIVAVGVAYLFTPLSAAHVIGRGGMWAIVELTSTLPFLIGGILAALLTEVMVRRPWDALAAGAVVGVYYAVWFAALGFLYSRTVVPPWMRYLSMASGLLAMLVGVVGTAWWLQRRALRRQIPPAKAT